MSRPDPFLRWVLERMARSRSEDRDAPVFDGRHADATRLDAADVAFVHALDDAPQPPEALIARADRLLTDHVANARTPRFQNQLYSGVHDEALAGYLAGVFTNNTLSTRAVAPLATEIERAVIEWLVALLPWDRGAAGGSGTPAGSFSNYLAVYLARRRATAKHGDGVLPRLAVVASETGHYSVPKGADLAGIPQSNVVLVPADDADRMHPEGVARALRDLRDRGLVPCLVSATLGTTVAGVLDPVQDLAGIAREHDTWFHVDAAWGGLGLCGTDAPRYARGLEHADSMTWDAHKAAASPLAASFLVVRDRGALASLGPRQGGGYLFRNVDPLADDADLGLTSLYCGKPFHALGMWLLWKSRGVSGIRAHADGAWALTRRFRDRIAASGRYELAQEPETPLVIFRPNMPSGATAAERDARSREIRARAVEDGRWLIRLCPYQGGIVFRALFANPLMDEAVADELADRMEEAAG